MYPNAKEIILVEMYVKSADYFCNIFNIKCSLNERTNRFAKKIVVYFILF